MQKTDGGLISSDEEGDGDGGGDETNTCTTGSLNFDMDFSNGSTSTSQAATNTNSRSIDFASSNSNSNRLFKKGQLLLKQAATKAALVAPPPAPPSTAFGGGGGDDAVAFGEPFACHLTANNNNTSNSNKEKATATSTVDFAKKFSFLGRDKGYLSRLSSYVTKSMHTNGHSSNAKAATRSNNMVFASIDINSNDINANGHEDTDMPAMAASKMSAGGLAAAGARKFATSAQQRNTHKNDLTKSKVTTATSTFNGGGGVGSGGIASEPKRLKLDTKGGSGESIFNHIN